MACSIVYGLAMIVPARPEDIRVALSPSYEAQRKQERIPYLESFVYLNSDAGVRRVMVWEPRVPTFDLRKQYLNRSGVSAK